MAIFAPGPRVVAFEDEVGVFMCWKVNEDATDKCRCCGRPRNFVPASLMISSKAKPLVLHGLAAAQHELHPFLVHALQQSGLDLADSDSTGWTALHCAAMLGDATAIQSQKRREEETGGWRALHLATRGGHLSAIEELLLADADVDARLDEADDALTPLHIAAQHGYIDLLDLLLQCGADPTLLTHHLRRSPLHLAVFAGHECCVRLLVAKPTSLKFSTVRVSHRSNWLLFVHRRANQLQSGGKALNGWWASSSVIISR
ncbi:Ankyrin repeat-containing domain [Phytophthora cactorum]|nr:Ankyrin repeat-containing domain [Phytophthora cactorum]